MSEKRFEDDGVEYNNNYNYALLDTYYEFDGKRIIEWNKHSDNAEYTDLERITEILNIKQMRLESLMKHREEIGKLFDRIDELKKDIDIYKYEEKKHSETVRKLYEENEQLRTQLLVCQQSKIDDGRIKVRQVPPIPKGMRIITSTTFNGEKDE